MMSYILNIGELIIGKKAQAKFRCLGLGSCIGIFLQDRIAGISGGAHILLPGDEFAPFPLFKYGNVSSALEEMLHQFKIMGSSLTTLRAKVTGGANVYPGSLSTGQRNVESVSTYLINHKIYIAAMDVGGVYSRSASFDCSTGSLHVTIPQTNESRIY